MAQDDQRFADTSMDDADLDPDLMDEKSREDNTKSMDDPDTDTDVDDMKSM